MTDESMLEQDVSAESSPEASDQNNQPVAQESEQSSQPAEHAKTEDNVPFHMHPRFQEVISEKNAFKEELQKLKREMETFRSNAPKPEPKKDALMERLQGIDPEFASRFGKLSEVDQLKAELAEFKSWREQSNVQAARANADATKEKFYSDNKVPTERREAYEAFLLQAAQANPQLKTSDLPQLLKDVHGKLSKMFSSMERNTAKDLVQGKKVDSARPNGQPKGPAPKGGNSEQPTNSRDNRSQLVKDLLADIRGQKDI